MDYLIVVLPKTKYILLLGEESTYMYHRRKDYVLSCDLDQWLVREQGARELFLDGEDDLQEVLDLSWNVSPLREHGRFPLEEYKIRYLKG